MNVLGFLYFGLIFLIYLIGRYYIYKWNYQQKQKNSEVLDIDSN
jgi:hypothetical protein